MSPIGFIESNGAEEEEGESKFNPTEAEMVQRLVQAVTIAAKGVCRP